MTRILNTAREIDPRIIGDHSDNLANITIIQPETSRAADGVVEPICWGDGGVRTPEFDRGLAAHCEEDVQDLVEEQENWESAN